MENDKREPMLTSALITALQMRLKAHGDLPAYVDLPTGPSAVMETKYVLNEKVDDPDDRESNGRSKFPSQKAIPRLILILHDRDL